MLLGWWVPSTDPECVSLLLRFCTCIKAKSARKLEYCSHIWAGSSKHELSSLDRIQHRIHGLVGTELFSSLDSLGHRRNVASLSLIYRYFHGKCADELHSLVPPIWEFTRMTRFAVTNAAHPRLLNIPRARAQFLANKNSR